MALWLEDVSDSRQIYPLVAGQPLIIGRGPNADIPISSLSVSRRHCEVYWDGCRVRVRDLNSHCGIWVNGTHVRNPEEVLHLGDVLQVGAPGLRLRVSVTLCVKPEWLTWNDATVPRIAQALREECAFERLPILADALEDAGCDNADILSHCRAPGPHVRGCWVVDLLLGKQ
jgi:hypothetical protein